MAAADTVLRDALLEAGEAIGAEDMAQGSSGGGVGGGGRGRPPQASLALDWSRRERGAVRAAKNHILCRMLILFITCVVPRAEYRGCE